METLESRVESLCSIITKSDNENWDAKNKAVVQMTELFLEQEGNQEVFTPALFRALKEPVKALVCDLRSQQVRDICTLLTTLAQVSGDKMKLFLRDSFPQILEGVKVPNKVMSGYVDDCIFQMIRFTTFKAGIIVLAQEVKDNKAKMFREKCLDYLNEILINWELSDKELDPICDSIRIGIEDASVKAREIARITYGNLFLLFPARSERIRNQLPKPIQSKLLAAEKLLREGRHNDESVHAEVGELDTSAVELVVPTPMPPPTPIHVPTPHKVEPRTEVKVPATRGVLHPPATATKTSTPRNQNNKLKLPLSESNLTARSADSNSSSSSSPISAIKEVSKTSTTTSTIDATEKVAPARGSRRRSVVKNPFADISDSFGANHSPGKHTISSMLKAQSPSTVRKSPSKDVPGMTKTKVIAPTFSRSSQPQPASSSKVASSTGRPASPVENFPPLVLGNDINILPQFDVLVEKHPSTDEADSYNRNQKRLEVLVQHEFFEQPIEQEEPLVLKVGSRVLVTWGKDPVHRELGFVRYMGTTLFAGGDWIGVELELPMGKNNGTIQGQFYFSCEPNYGLFVRADNVQVVAQTVPKSPTFESGIVSELSTTSESENTQPDEYSPPQHQEMTQQDDTVIVGDDQTLPLSLSQIGRSSSQSSTGYSSKRKTASVLKIKLSQMMNLLNQQLELVEQLEQAEKTVPEDTQQDKLHELRDEVNMITAQELDIVEGFRKRWKDLCSL